MREDASEFELEVWEREARRHVTCTGCYGSGEDRWQQGRACETCSGSARMQAEPHVLRLIAEVRRWRAGSDP